MRDDLLPKIERPESMREVPVSGSYVIAPMHPRDSTHRLTAGIEPESITPPRAGTARQLRRRQPSTEKEDLKPIFKIPVRGKDNG